MNHHLTQIAVLLMTYVAFNDGTPLIQCPPSTIRPVNVPQEYLIGTWSAAYCGESQLCSPHINCNQYHFNTTGAGNIMMYVHGYNEMTQKVDEYEGKVQFTNLTGTFIIENLGDIKTAKFIMMHAEKHFAVLYGCFMDNHGKQTQAAFVSTKDDPNNQLSENELATAKSIIESNKLDWDSMITPPYKNCNNVN